MLNKFCKQCYENSAAKGFWNGPENDNIPTKIALIHSELSEMLEAFRNNNPYCEKPIDIVENGETRRITSMEEEAADIFIRLGDLCGRLGIDLDQAVAAKMKYNSIRSHMHGGKRV